ncbi:hypothetical protein K5D69_06500 [Pseudomonas cichorii]|uniref:hypothetical protein n=1 Tax=Pseudomonas cichorii TaxID=36746 RepID=UPI001C8A110E|nr:hypothetical protein [Pseudomonas cichorii]MBX8514346.1 hypothetical protein [Pseudomonas cichorii]
MNINSPSPALQNWQPPAIEPALSAVSTDKISSTPPAAIKRGHDANEAFYRPEKSPWLPKTSKGEILEPYKNLSDKTTEDMRKNYLEKELKTFTTSMHAMFDNFHDFKQQLSFLNTALSKKHFGFTLGLDQQIKVTDPDGVLTPAELSYLTESLNDRSGLKKNLLTHAKSVMTLTDHYTEKFGNEHRLNLEAYSKVIDYGQIFSRNTIGNFMNTIIYQIERFAPKREDNEKPLVDIRA